MRELRLNEPRFIDLLRRLVSHTPRLQNCPDVGLIPEEKLAADIVLEALAPHIESGFIEAGVLAAPGHEKRPSLVLKVAGTGQGEIGFVGAHFDVVPADREAEGWVRDPFELHVGDDGTLFARGVTDCLGHVAVLTDLLLQLAERGARPERSLTVVMISNEEEAPVREIGLDYVVDNGHVDHLKDGTVFWLDSADFGPTVGTGGIAMWELEARGVTGHSGMSHNCVNALELGMATSLALRRWFEERYPPHPDEKRWKFVIPSTLKATVVSGQNIKITTIPGAVTLRGDIRLTPFYDLEEAISGAEAFVAELDAKLEADESPRGFPRSRAADGRRGSVKLTRKGRSMEGIACHLDSPGLAALEESIVSVRGKDGTFSMTGSLPLIRDLQRRGFDVQITGFGQSRYYHAPNEQGELSEFAQGFRILCELLDRA